jgi:hypothetical protein
MKHLGRLGLAGGVVALAGAVVLGSNPGVFLDYTLLGPEGSASGTNWIGLPYASDVQTAAQLYTRLGGPATVTSVARWDSATDSLQVYSGGTAGDFPILPAEGLQVTMKSSLAFPLVGSHDPKRVVTLLGPEGSASGSNQYAPPYHGVAATAGALEREIARSCGTNCVVSISRFVRSNDSLVTYTGSTSGDFPLVRGESYRIRVTRTVHYLPEVVR